MHWRNGMEQISPLRPRSTSARKLSSLTVAGAVVSGLLASACCLGPLILAAIGIGGAGLLARFEAYRPVLTVTTFGLLGAGFWLAYRKPKAAEGDDCGCEYPKAGRLGRALLWIAAAVAIGLWSFPYLAERLLG
jgi:mercuric ion transport protein